MPAPPTPGVHDFIDFDETITAALVEDYLMGQAVPRFATTADRDAQIPAPVENQLCAVTGIGPQRYDGSTWVTLVLSVAGRSGAVTLTKADVGLNLVDNTADLAKPVSTATQTALNAKANTANPALTGTVTIDGVGLGTWQTYTPAVGGAGWSLGNGTVVAGRYVRIGKTVTFVAHVAWGTTSTFGGGAVNLSLPVAANGMQYFGQGGAVKQSVNSYHASVLYWTATTVEPVIPATTGSSQPITATWPQTWAAGDTLWVAGTYEAA